MTLIIFLIILIIGLVQIIGEMLPVSSSSHVFLVKHVLKKIYHAPTLPFSLSDFDHFLHGATFITIAIFFRVRFISMLRSLFFFSSQTPATQARLRRYTWSLIGTLCITTLLTLGIYFPIKYMAKSLKHSFELLQCIGLLISMILLIMSSKTFKQQSLSSFSIFLLLGIAQGCAAFPGISRLAITYATGKLVGLRSSQAFYNSLVIHLPLCLGGFLLGSYKLLKAHALFFLLSPWIIIPLACATIVSYLILYGTYQLALRNNLKWFSIYLILPLLSTLFLYITRNT